MIAFAWCLALALVGVLGDALVKRTSNGASYLFALCGAFLYALSALGWVRAMRVVRLATIAPYYASATLLLLVGVGVFVFGEHFRLPDGAGVGLVLAGIFVIEAEPTSELPQ